LDCQDLVWEVIEALIIYAFLKPRRHLRLLKERPTLLISFKWKVFEIEKSHFGN